MPRDNDRTALRCFRVTFSPWITPGRPVTNKYNEELQAVRAIAIGMVLIAHSAGLFVWDQAGWAQVGKGFLVGVDLFLCLSGYVITKSVATTLLKAQGTDFWRAAAAFWVRRIYRITPSAWIWLAIPMIAFTLHRGYSSADMADMIASVMHVQNIRVWFCFWAKEGTCGSFGLYWSLSLEEQFYLLLPFVFLFCGRRLVPVLVALVIVQVFYPKPLGHFLGAVRTEALLIGVLLAIWTERASYKIFDPSLTASRLRFILPPLLLLCLVGVVRYAFVPFYFGLAAVVAGLIIWLCSYDRGYFIPAGVVRSGLVWIGERSFAIYLIHLFAFWLTARVMEQIYPGVAFNGTFTVRFLVLGLVLTVLLAELSYRFIEVPFRRRGAMRATQIMSSDVIVKPLPS
ncbi:acyltransferase [Cupriavidus sp. SZY C1]|nr:acyltransferase [Cupriavidus sp. SZY C1]